MLRLFVALELPNELKCKIAQLKDELCKEIRDVKWVSEKNIHMTLKFLGNCEEEMLPDIKSGLEFSVKKFSPFDLCLNGLGVFPSAKNARVFWVGVEDGGKKIINLQQAIEKGLVKTGFAEDEKRFSPHITFARLKKPHNVEQLLQKVGTKGFSGYRVEVNNIYLFRSHLMANGPVYEKILELKLKTD